MSYLTVTYDPASGLTADYEGACPVTFDPERGVVEAPVI